MNRTCYVFSILLGFLICLTAIEVHAATPAGGSNLKVVLRQTEDNSGPVYSLEATLPYIVRKSCQSDPLADGCLAVTATIFSSEKIDADTTANRIFVDDVSGSKSQIVDLKIVETCNGDLPSNPGTFCVKATRMKPPSVNEVIRLIVIYRFAAPPTLKDDKYSISVKIANAQTGVEGYSASAKLDYPVDDPTVTIVPIGEFKDNPQLTPMGQATMYTAGKPLELDPRYNVIKILFQLPSVPSPAMADSEEERIDRSKVLLQRVRRITAWLDQHQHSPSTLAEIKYELRDGSSLEPAPANAGGAALPTSRAAKPLLFQIEGFAFVGQALDRTPNPALVQTCPGSGPLVPELHPPLSARELSYFCDERITVYLFGKGNLPSKPFLLKATVNGNPQLELAAVSNATVTSDGVKAFATPKADAVGSNKALALRTAQFNLDLGGAFTSSVNDEKVNDQTVRKRKNLGALDLMFAPILDRYITKESKSRQWTATPFFVDAKIDSGKLTESTLSVNRIVVGSGLGLVLFGNELKGDATHPNDLDKFKLSFRVMSASDRDFKRAEANFNFETLFRFAKLNRSLALRTRDLPASALDPKAGPAKEVPAGSFGYQIQPTVGLDLGRLYRNKRESFTGEEQEKFIRRLYVGLDLQFDLTRHFKLSFKDTAYFRGETPRDRVRNYFIGTFETGLGNFGDGGAQSIYFSFERGDQPPFRTLGANSFKIGYRITSNFGSNGSIY